MINRNLSADIRDSVEKARQTDRLAGARGKDAEGEKVSALPLMVRLLNDPNWYKSLSFYPFNQAGKT